MTRIGVVSSHPDTLSRREADQDRKRESKSLYVTIQEAARRCGVSDKTIQRAICAGTLSARYPRLNRCEIAESRLNSFKSGHIQTATKQSLAEQVSGHVQEEIEQRLPALEERIQQLEHLIAELLDRPAAPKRQSKAKARERTTGPLPKQFVSLLAFAWHHNIAESMVQTHMGMGVLPVKRGA
jgi:DNA-binding transcriptional MerR regulator